ncbi:hypothetical protein AB0D10_01280 [Kitasatospora sp. NPDC048545]|uniref:hypothetical protein n=1 Tax=Kitasatospora sp. NPDC048545 TaxID=3157208 RepID=UPI0034029FE6
MPYSTINVVAVEIPGPAHHHEAIAAAIRASYAGPNTVRGAFLLAEHAITATWPVRPTDLLCLTFRQFHETVVHHYFADLVRQSLAVDADFACIDEVASSLRTALLYADDLMGRKHSR